MNKAAQFLSDCGTFFLATDDNGQPRVRPFGAVIEYEGKTWICTNNTKDCFKQMLKNPKVEISASKGNQWIRIQGEAVSDSRKEVKQQMLEEIPMLKSMYNAEDDKFEVLYLKNALATIYSYTTKPESLEI
ncbi:MAG: pyridoxamine 5'-phosphate oxidase family protein [Solirubrobacterales bacterium]